jgi:hypothetical protein
MPFEGLHFSRLLAGNRESIVVRSLRASEFEQDQIVIDRFRR